MDQNDSGDLKGGCGCALIFLAACVFFNTREILDALVGLFAK